MTREALLKASINEFKDNVKNAYVFNCKRIVTSSGYVYLIKDINTRKEISCAIHWNASFESDDKIGKRETNDVSINTREKIDFDSLVEYNGLTIAIVSQDDYNNTMGQWHYNGIASLPINNRFLVTTDEEIITEIGINSMSLFMALDLGYPLIPSFYSAQNKAKFIMIDIQDSHALTPMYRNESEILQYRTDRVRMSFINFSTLEAMECIEKLENYTINEAKQVGFAINDILNLRDDNIYQKSFDWKSLTYVTEFNVNYYLKANSKRKQILIKEALFNAMGSL